MHVFRIAGIGRERLLLAKIVRSADALVQFAVLSNRAGFHTYATGKSTFDNQFLMVDRAGNSVEIRSDPSRVRHKRVCGAESSTKLATLAEILLNDESAREPRFREQRHIADPRPILWID